MRAGKKGLFITFEGIEGCGKTTQIRRLAKRLGRRGVPVLTTKEPGGTAIGQGIRRMLLDARNRHLSPVAEWMLYAADRAQHVEEVIRPALRQGKWVLCDRFMDATEVYQGWARGQDTEMIRIINEILTGGIRPRRTFLLDLPVETGLRRALKRNLSPAQRGQDRFEREHLSFHRKVRKAYLQLARREPERFIVIEASGTQGEIEAAICRHIEALLPP
ncbi:MAG: dTMP kinase [Deltaproteobacteria bacterium]|nr:dTMP kinase [Deltaproteobacteria bacterium]